MKTYEFVIVGILGIVAVVTGIWLFKALIGLIIPIAIVGGVGYVLYRSLRRRSLPWRRRRPL
ncbi:MAG: hypothetical protein IT207_00515 [Fimbriimonadaceae bacterium]|nr:hypothetical protein [Fimbriimonadaceae bacterium]